MIATNDIDKIQLTVYPIWNHQPSEDNVSFERFTKYYKKQVGNRSVLGAYNAYRLEKTRKDKTSYSPADAPAKQWEEQHEKYRWEERAAAWARYQLHKEEEYWQEKRRQLIDEELKAASKILAKSIQITEMPLVTQEVVRTYEDGRPVQIIINPNDKWGHRDAATLLKTASEVSRKALGMDDLDHMIEKLTAAGYVIIDPSKEEKEEDK